MGLRLRKSFNLGPFRATISKSGVSTSVGTKGYRVTKLANGKVMKTASIPGTGISHVTVQSHKAPVQKKHGKGPLIAGLAAVVLLLGLIGGCSSGKKEEEPPADPPAATEAATSRDDVAVVPDPEPQPAPEPETSAPVASVTEENTQATSDLPDPEPVPVPQPEPESEPEPAPPSVPQPEPEPEPEKPAASEPVGPAVIGNKNSKVYHELDCGSVKKMKDSNKVSFDNADAAKAKGYDPCQNCH